MVRLCTDKKKCGNSYRMIKAFICVLFISLFSGLAYGDIYFWTDESGVKHFTNIAPPLNARVEALKESRNLFQKLTSREDAKFAFTVLKVFDGDTIKVKGLDLVFKIRLVGIDSPEIGFNGQKSQPFSQKAKQHLVNLLSHKPVFIKSYGIGGYNRQLAEVFVAGKNINLEMIRAGLAEVYQGQRPKNLDSKRYFKTEATAKRAKKGIWIQGAGYKSPKQWRKEHPRK